MANPDTKLLQEGKIYSFYCNQRHTLHPYSERPRKGRRKKGEKYLEKEHSDRQSKEGQNINREIKKK